MRGARERKAVAALLEREAALMRSPEVAPPVRRLLAGAAFLMEAARLLYQVDPPRIRLTPKGEAMLNRSIGLSARERRREGFRPAPNPTDPEDGLAMDEIEARAA